MKHLRLLLLLVSGCGSSTTQPAQITAFSYDDISGAANRVSSAARAEAVAALGRQTFADLYAHLMHAVSDAPLTIGGRQLSGLHTRLQAARGRIEALNQDYPTLAAYWDNRGISAAAPSPAEISALFHNPWASRGLALAPTDPGSAIARGINAVGRRCCALGRLCRSGRPTSASGPSAEPAIPSQPEGIPSQPEGIPSAPPYPSQASLPATPPFPNQVPLPPPSAPPFSATATVATPNQYADNIGNLCAFEEEDGTITYAKILPAPDVPDSLKNAAGAAGLLGLSGGAW